MKDVIKIVEILKDVEKFKTIDFIAQRFISLYVDIKGILNVDIGETSHNVKYKITGVNIPDNSKCVILYIGKFQDLTVNHICNIDRYISFTDSKHYRQIKAEKFKKHKGKFSIISDRCLNTFITMFNSLTKFEDTNNKIKIAYELCFEVRLHYKLYQDLIEYKNLNKSNITELNSNHIYYTGDNWQEYFVKLSDTCMLLKMKGSLHNGITYIDIKVTKYNKFSKSYLNSNNPFTL